MNGYSFKYLVHVWLRHTRSRVLSTKLIPVHLTNRHFFTKMTDNIITNHLVVLSY